METNLALYQFIIDELKKLIPLVGIKPTHDLTVKRKKKSYIGNGDSVSYKYSKDIEYYFFYTEIMNEFISFKHNTFECRFTKENLFRFKKELELLIPKKHHQQLF